MTISNASRTAGPFIGDGVGTAFPFSYKVFARADLLVARTVTATSVETILVLDADYTVTLNADQNATPGGTITLTAPLATGTTLAATSNLPIQQSLDLTNNGGFYPTVINDALDRIVITIQQLAARVGSGALNVGAAANIAAILATLTNFASSVGASLIGFIQAGTGAILRTVQDRLREVLSAMDYALKGDTVTNNRPALAIMMTTLGAVYSAYQVRFPNVANGEYLIASDITIGSAVTLEFAAGAKLLIPNGVTVTLDNVDIKAGRAQIFKFTGTGKVVGTVRNDLIFPEWWGALADGLHPPVGADFSARAAAAARNSGPIQAAMNFAGNQYSVNGLTGSVSLAYGRYLHDATITVPLSVNVIGYGIGSGLYYYSGTGNAMECISTNNTMLKDFFLAPIGGPTWNFTTGYGLYMDGVSTPIVDNIWSSEFGAGTFFFRNVIEGRIRGCISDNSNGPAFVIRGVGQGSVIENCITAGTEAGPCFDIQSGYDWHLLTCTAKDGGTGTIGYYLNACENITLTACGAHDINRQGILTTSSTLNCTINGCFVNGASTSGSGSYAAMDISGSRNKLIAPKVTQNTPTYSYALILGGGATDCSYTQENFTAGTVGSILDAQPTGSNTSLVRKASTTDATPLNIWAKSFNNNAGAILEATVVAKQRGNAASAVYKFWVHATTGSVSTALVSGPTSIYAYESDALLNATFVLTTATANAGVVSLQVTGLAAGQPVDWEATVSVISVTG